MYLTHNERLGVMAGLTFFAGVFSLSCITSSNPIPSIVLAVSIGWWLLFGYANNWFRELRDNGDDSEDMGRGDTATQSQREIRESNEISRR